jgi:hypothetical protein
MSEILLNDDDVISMEPGQNFTKTSTSKIREVRNSLISDWLKGLGNWLGDGVKCEVLLAQKTGWHKGKIRLRIEFVPNSPEDFTKPAPDTDSVFTPSPLDDLRTDLKI